MQQKCRKEQDKIKKREFDARAEKSEDTSPKTLSKMKSAFEDFMAEALKRKTAVNKGQSSPKEFEDWILVQSSILYYNM